MRTIETFEFVTTKRASKYNWDAILNGSKNLLLSGEDYSDPTAKMVGRARKAGFAKKLAVLVNAVKREGKKLVPCKVKEAVGLVIQAVEATPDQLAEMAEKARAKKAKSKARRAARKAKAASEAANGETK